ncbi:TPA: hypothetical protein I8636_003818, partial [Morganella morganii]|nr:hypothetical protein [Morganella morganii]
QRGRESPDKAAASLTEKTPAGNTSKKQAAAVVISLCFNMVFYTFGQLLFINTHVTLTKRNSKSYLFSGNKKPSALAGLVGTVTKTATYPEMVAH